MRYLFLDTETTSLSSKRNVIQLGSILTDLNFNIIETYDRLFKDADEKLTVESMAVTGITPEMIADKPTLSQALYKIPSDVILIGHNIEFDIVALKNHNITFNCPVVDTYKVAYAVLEEKNSYSLQYLRYELGLYKEEPKNIKQHSALDDCYICMLLFKRLLRYENNLEKLVEISNNPVRLHRIKFGKYKGTRFEDIKDLSYLRWLYNSEGTKPEGERNEDLLYTISLILKGAK